MPELFRLAVTSGDGPGFLLPLFRAYAGANHLLVQKIDVHDTVVDLAPVFDNGQPLLPAAPGTANTAVGQTAVWAYRFPNGVISVGTSKSIQTAGFEALKAGEFKTYPLAAAELVCFCEAQTHFADILLAAFAELEKISPDSAATWRDTMILAPALREDVAQINEKRKSRDRAPRDLFAVSRGSKTHLYYTGLLAASPRDFPNWRALAKIFGIDELVIERLPVGRSRAGEEAHPMWTLLGFGGIANFVIKRPPFNGTLHDAAVMPGCAIARGAIVSQADGRPLSPLVIGIVSSDVSAAERLEQQIDYFDSGAAIRHIINVRPIGFGTPSPAKASVSEMLAALPGADFVWIVASHRLRQTGRFANALTASNVASRYARVAAQALIATMVDDLPGLYDAPADFGRLGIAGAATYSNQLSPKDRIRRVLYTMLCEDAYLHSAERIIMFAPYGEGSEPRSYLVRLGRHQYPVELFRRPHKSGTPDQVGFAIGVTPSKRTAKDFEDFCVALFSGYGWRERRSDGRQILFENEGEALRVWPAPDISTFQRLLDRDSEYGALGDVIVTNKSISKPMRHLAEARDWSLLHYSEIERWMREHYGAKVFQDW